MARYEITSVEASYRKPHWKPEGPLGWSFSVESEPVDGGSPHRRLLECVAKSFPGLQLTLNESDGSGNYLDGLMDWQGSEIIIWSELLEGFLYLWSIEREPIEELRSAVLKLAPGLF